MDFKRSWNLLNVYNLMTIALLILTVYNIQKFGLSVVFPIISIVLATILVDLAINYAKERKFSFPKSALITALILAVIIEGGILFLILIAVIAILSKHIIRIKGRHIFNPAVFALFVALFLPVSQSWWGAGNLLLVLFLGLVVVFKLKRLHLAAAFLAVHAAAMVLVFFSANQLTDHFMSGALIFFTFYMLVEPVTSPVKINGRIVFAALAGFFAAILYVAWLPAMLVGALFFADLMVPLMNRITSKPKQPAPELPPDSPPTNPNW